MAMMNAEDLKFHHDLRGIMRGLAARSVSQQCNPVLRVWWNYYGALYRKAMDRSVHVIDQKLELWARRKYKPLAGRYQRSAEWLRKMKQVFPQMFIHWRHEGYKIG